MNFWGARGSEMPHFSGFEQFPENWNPKQKVFQRNISTFTTWSGGRFPSGKKKGRRKRHERSYSMHEGGEGGAGPAAAVC